MWKDNKGQVMFEMEAVPCKCGIKHEHGDGNYEFFYMKMVADDSPLQLPPRRTARCKFCKQVLMQERKSQPKRLNPEALYPKGSMWQDDSSLGEDGLVNLYVMNEKWEFLKRAPPLYFFSPIGMR